MEGVQKNILIISHSFPPTPGIGGRRWAKFAKYLRRNGHTVHVLAAENIHIGSSQWVNDTKNLNVEFLPYRFPKVLNLPVKSITDKLHYRLALSWVRITDRGNYYDKGIFWKKQLHEKIGSYIADKKVDTVITTGAPFRLTYYSVLLKNKYPEVKFVTDFRDLWTADTEISAFAGLSEKRKNVESALERYVVENSDLVMTVSESINEYFKGLSAKSNCKVLPNGYDPDDILPTSIKRNEPQEATVRFVFAGTLYDNLHYILEPFFDTLRDLKNTRPDLYQICDFAFYGKFPQQYKRYLNGIEDRVLVAGEKPYEYITGKTENAHYALLFLNTIYNSSFSTKFCEYIALGKKIMVLASGGATARYVRDNKLGHHLDEKNLKSDLIRIIEYTRNSNFTIETNDHFDRSIFSVEQLTRQLETYLINKTTTH